MPTDSPFESFDPSRVLKLRLAVARFGEMDGAIGEFQRYLVLAPDGQFATQARNALAVAVEQSPGSGSVPTTAPPTT